MQLSVVASMYFSENYLQEFHQRIVQQIKSLGLTYELIFVDDGSPDRSLQKALRLQEADNNIKIIELSRNFGHQKAMMTGLKYATGDYVFLIDCDLEERPELLSDFWKKLAGQNLYDVIYGVQHKRKGDLFEKASGRIFYRALSWFSGTPYPEDTLTARLMTSRYVKAVVAFSEKELDLWSVFVFTGFNQLPFVTAKGYKGKSSYSLFKKIKRSVDVITAFSHRPLYITFFLGSISSIIAMIMVITILYKKWVQGVDVEGWASILASIWLVGGMILLVLGIFGIYLSRMFLEIKNRPLAVIKNVFTK